MLKQITKGLNHLHILGIVHGDLQPSNILISQPSGDLGPSLKLADFGLSHAYGREYDPNHTERRFRPAFTEGWICLSDPIDEDGERELSSDIFPLGVLYAFVALKGVHPFGKDLEEAVENIKNRQPMPLNVREFDPTVTANDRSEAFLQLLAKMVSYDPSERPTTSQVLDHPFFTLQPIMTTVRQEQESAPTVEPVVHSLPSTASPSLLSREAPAKKVRLVLEEKRNQQTLVPQLSSASAVASCSSQARDEEFEANTMQRDETDPLMGGNR